MSDTDVLLSTRECNGVTVIGFNRSEIFDVEVAEDLEFDLKKLIQARPGSVWVIDFTGVDVIISRVVSSLLLVLRIVRSHGGSIRLCGLGETVERVITLAKLDRVFHVYGTLDEAIAATK